MKTPVLVCCPLCNEPLELLAGALACGCSRVGSSEVPKLDAQELRFLAERYGILDGREKTVEEIARARGTTRSRMRILEARAVGKWRAIARSVTVPH